MSRATNPAAGREWIARLGLAVHPEGGWFRRIHTDAVTVATPHGPRPRCTSIHYLLTREQPLGRLHRNRSEILHYLQDGGPVEYWLLDAAGVLSRIVLGRGEGEHLFLRVPGGVWKASRLACSTSHALISEVVVPGFDVADHQFADDSLLAAHPEHAPELAPFISRSFPDPTR